MRSLSDALRWETKFWKKANSSLCSIPAKPKLGGKKIALFGSYGWGDGEWMRNWDEECSNLGADMACDYVICNETPDDDGIADCKALGAALV